MRPGGTCAICRSASWSGRIASRVPRERCRAMRRLVPVLFLLALVASCGPERDEGFRLIHVDDLVALQQSSDAKVTIVDANGAEFRAREGIVPGAVLLSNYKTYDADKELPAGKDARLVFYCADSH